MYRFTNKKFVKVPAYQATKVLNSLTKRPGIAFHLNKDFKAPTMNEIPMSTSSIDIP